jgi:transcriptional regulator with XRE-family HTH domain
MQSTNVPGVAGVAARLRAARAAAKVTNGELAKACHVHEKTIQRWQRGEPDQGIPYAHILTMADVLDVDPVWLFAGDHIEATA